MTQVVNKIWKYKYIIGSIILIFSFTIISYNVYFKKEKIYILFDKSNNCKNRNEYQSDKYYTVCHGKNKLFFEKKYNNYKTILNLKKIDIISKDNLFKIKSNEKFKQNEQYLFFMIIKNKNKFDIVPVKMIDFFS